MKLTILFLLVIILSNQLIAQNSENDLLVLAKNLQDLGKEKKRFNYFYEAIETYKKLIKEYPDSDTIKFSYRKIADIFFDFLDEYANAIKYYNIIYNKFPNTKDARESFFLIAFIYDAKLNDKIKAIEAYKKFLDKYPNDTEPNMKLSESAKAMLQILESDE